MYIAVDTIISVVKFPECVCIYYVVQHSLPLSTPAWRMHVCWQLPSNQSFYREVVGYGMSVGDYRVARRWKGVMGQQISYMYMALIEMHSTMHLINVMNNLST